MKFNFARVADLDFWTNLGPEALSRAKEFSASQNSDDLNSCLSKLSKWECAADVPKEILDRVCEASQDAAARRTIMQHIYKNLGDTAGWREKLGALILLDALIKRGDPRVLEESQTGLHFDVIQKLTFLTTFEFESDRRVQWLLRDRAKNLRERFLREPGTESEKKDKVEGEKDDRLAAPATRRGEDTPNEDQAECTVSGSAKRPMQAAQQQVRAAPVQQGSSNKSRTVLNGVVAVGHSEDTDDEESGGEEVAPRPPAEKRGGRPRDEVHARSNPQEGGGGGGGGSATAEGFPWSERSRTAKPQKSGGWNSYEGSEAEEKKRPGQEMCLLDVDFVRGGQAGKLADGPSMTNLAGDLLPQKTTTTTTDLLDVDFVGGGHSGKLADGPSTTNPAGDLLEQKTTTTTTTDLLDLL